MPEIIKIQCCLLLLKILRYLPASINTILAKAGGFLLDASKGHIARATLKLAFPTLDTQSLDPIARKAAFHSVNAVFALPRLGKIPYQLNDLAIISETMKLNRGVIIVALHMGPPDIGTLALTRQNIPISTVIGAGNQKPWLNKIGQHILSQWGIRFTQRGNPVGLMKALRKKEAIVLHSDMRSREAPVTFFGKQTTAPVSAINMALNLKVPVIFHYSTLQDGIWQLHFERFHMTESGSPGPEDASLTNLQALFKRMEDVIRQHPDLWIWHYDRFKLKRELNIENAPN